MEVTFRMRSNGTDAEIVALDCGPGPHDVEIRRLPGGGRVAHAFWDGMGDRELYTFVNEPIPEKISIQAYGKVNKNIDLGETKTVTVPKKIEEPIGETEVPNFYQVEDRPIVDPLLAPCDNYDDLTVKQIKERLGDVAPEDLSPWREYEAQNKNRKGVLSAIDEKGQTLNQEPEPGDDDGNTEVYDESKA